MTSNSYLDISLKTSTLNFKMEQEEKSGIQQSQWDSPSGNQEGIFLNPPNTSGDISV